MPTPAKVIEDSITPDGERLTTVEAVMHRFVLAEFNTHCVFSRNSASSRAIPVQKQIERVMQHPALPVRWTSEQQGMQGGDEIERPEVAEDLWIGAKAYAVEFAERLKALGVHKSITNRLIEPWMWHTVVCTATAWQNFFRQRCSPLAQPEIRETAEAIRVAMEDSKPTELLPGQWHLPYTSEDEKATVRARQLRLISVARCARVSYLTQDGKRDLQADLALYDRLITARPMHASPLEHVASPAPWNRQEVEIIDPDTDEVVGSRTLPKVGKFQGWVQWRHVAECRADLVSYE